LITSPVELHLEEQQIAQVLPIRANLKKELSEGRCGLLESQLRVKPATGFLPRVQLGYVVHFTRVHYD